MKLTAKGRYAVMAVADLAAQGPNACESLSSIASRQHISITFLEQLCLRYKDIKGASKTIGALEVYMSTGRRSSEGEGRYMNAKKLAFLITLLNQFRLRNTLIT